MYTLDVIGCLFRQNAYIPVLPACNVLLGFYSTSIQNSSTSLDLYSQLCEWIDTLPKYLAQMPTQWSISILVMLMMGGGLALILSVAKLWSLSKNIRIWWMKIVAQSLIVFYCAILVYVIINTLSLKLSDILLIPFSLPLLIAIIVISVTIIKNYYRDKIKGRYAAWKYPTNIEHLRMFREDACGIVISHFDIEGEIRDKRAYSRKISEELRSKVESTFYESLREMRRNGMDYGNPELDVQCYEAVVTNHSEAKEVGSRCNARLVIWGTALMVEGKFCLYPRIRVVDFETGSIIKAEKKFPVGSIISLSLNEFSEGKYPRTLVETPMQFIFVILGWRYVLEAKLHVAEAFLDKAVKFVESNTRDLSDPKEKSNLYALRGSICLLNVHLNKATESSKKACDWHSDCEPGLFVRGLCSLFSAFLEERDRFRKTPTGRKAMWGHGVTVRSTISTTKLDDARGYFGKARSLQSPYLGLPSVFEYLVYKTKAELAKEKAHTQMAETLTAKGVFELEKAVDEIKNIGGGHLFTSISVYIILASEYQRTGRLDRAINMIQENRRLFPDTLSTVFAFCRIYETINQIQLAEAELHKLMNIRLYIYIRRVVPLTLILHLHQISSYLIRLSAVYNLLGIMYYKDSNMDGALDMFFKARRVNKWSLAAAHNVLHVCYKKGTVDDPVVKKTRKFFQNSDKSKIKSWNAELFFLEDPTNDKFEIVRRKKVAEFREEYVKNMLCKEGPAGLQVLSLEGAKRTTEKGIAAYLKKFHK